MVTPLSWKVIVPVIPFETVAVSVTAWPVTDGFNEDASVIPGVSALSTTCAPADKASSAGKTDGKSMTLHDLRNRPVQRFNEEATGVMAESSISEFTDRYHEGPEEMQTCPWNQ